jgi:hypothetical protein
MKTVFYSRRSGYAFLMILIALAIIVLLYSVFFSGGFNKSVDVDSHENVLPWSQEYRLLDKDKEVPPTLPAQPKLDKIIGFDLNARQDDQHRGELAIVIDTAGRVSGYWKGNYYNAQKTHFAILGGSFKGNVDPSNIFADENGKEYPAMLYFIAKGKFLLKESDLKSKLAHRGGTIYITGWLGSDYSTFGEVTITSDNKYYEVFDFSADRPSGNF